MTGSGKGDDPKKPSAQPDVLPTWADPKYMSDEDREEAAIAAQVAEMKQRGEFRTPQDAMNMRTRLANQAHHEQKKVWAKDDAQSAEDIAAAKETAERIDKPPPNPSKDEPQR